jgi:hypothetical protein
MDVIMNEKQIVIASYGGGTNSTAGIIDRVNNKLPIDLILFADTGGERPETYVFIKHFSEWLSSKGYPSITFVAHRETLEDECLRESRLPSKAFGFGSCSDKFKIQPQRRFIKKWQPAIDARARGEEIISLVFYDAGEPHRAENQKKEKGTEKVFPLIDAWIDRDGCKEIISESGFCQPGKSSCWFCPSMKKHEIKHLEANHPDLMKRALDLEQKGMNAVKSDTIRGLGRHFSWADFLNQGDLFPELFQEQYLEESCGCYDG